MPELDPHMRAAIDAAVAAGRVRPIPTGVSGIPLPVWNGTHLIDPEGEGMRRRIREAARAAAARFRPRPVDPEVARRREAVRQRHANGEYARDMARDLGVKEPLIYADMRAMSLAPNTPPRGGDPDAARALSLGVVQRHADVCRLWHDGLTIASVADRLGISINIIKHDLTFLRKAGRIGRRIAAKDAA